MADEDHLTSIPPHHFPTDHDLEISSAALDNVNPADNANLGESSSSNSSSGGGVVGGRSSSRSRVSGGHERRFVQPSSYLRPRGLPHPMASSQPERAVDAEEQMGLVSA